VLHINRRQLLALPLLLHLHLLLLPAATASVAGGGGGGFGSLREVWKRQAEPLKLSAESHARHIEVQKEPLRKAVSITYK
jgi:hypothetical protein